MNDKNNVIKAIKHNLQILNSVVLLIVLVLFVLNIRFLYEVLNYIPSMSIVTMITIIAVLVLISLYLSRKISRRSILELEKYDRDLKTEIADRKNAEAQIKQQNEDMERKLLEIAELRETEEERLSELNLANEQLRIAIDETEFDNRVKLEFFAKVNQEICSHLNTIVSVSDLKLYTNLLPDQRNNISIAKDSANNIIELLDIFMDILNMESGKGLRKESTFDLRVALDEIITKLSRPARQKDVDLLCHVDNDIPEMLEGDIMRLKQVLIHVISNAIKFTENGKVIVNVEDGSLGNNKNIQNGGIVFLHFMIRDTGIGMSKEEIDDIFNCSCHRNGSVAGGYVKTGIGLNITNKLVHMMGGEIWVESERGKGSIFHFTSKFNKVSEPENRETPTQESQMSKLKYQIRS